MTSIKLGSLLAVLAVLAGMLIAQENPSFFIDESIIHAALRNGTTAVIVPVSNTSDHSIKAVLSLAWLSVDEMESSSLSKEVALQPGHLEIETPLPLVDPSIWTRLRCSVVPDRAVAH